MVLKVWIVLMLFSVAACSGKSGDKTSEGEAVSFASVVEKSDKLEGLFDIYRDKDSGETKAQFDYLSQSTALQNFQEIESEMTADRGVDSETRAHRANILYTIRRGLDTKS